MKKRLIIIDDDIEITGLLKVTLKDEDYSVDFAATGEEGLRLLDEYYYHVAILDLKLPDIYGMDILKMIKEKNPYCDVIIVSAYPNVDTAIKAFKSGCFDYVIKPFNIEDMKNIVQKCLEKQRFSRDIAKLRNLVELNDIKEIVNSFFLPNGMSDRILELALSFLKASGGMILNKYKRNVPEISAHKQLSFENQVKIAEYFEKNITAYIKGEIINDAYNIFGKDVYRIIVKSLKYEDDFYGLLILFRSNEFADEFIEENIYNLNDFAEFAAFILVKYENLKKEYLFM